MDLYLRQAPGSAKDPWLRSEADRHGPLVPEVPTELTTTVASSTQRDLSWTAPFNGGSTITGYKVEKETPTGAGGTTVTATTGSSATTYSDTSATLARTNYRISAINAIGTGPVSVPSDIPIKSGLLFDLFADVISQADNSALSTWSDRGGSANDATGGVGAIFRNTGGIKYVTFNGSTHYFVLPSYLGEIKTVFFVARLDGVGAHHTILGAQALSTSSPFGAFEFMTRSDATHATTRSYFDDAGPVYTTGATPSANTSVLAKGGTAPTATWFLQTGIIDGDTGKVRVAGSIVASDSATGTKLNVDGPIVLGASYYADSLINFWDGDVRRVIAYDRVLTAEEIVAVEQYIADDEGGRIALLDDLDAAFSGAISGFNIFLTDGSVTPSTTTITAWTWRYWLTSAPGSILGTTGAQNPVYVVTAGTFTFELTVTNSDGNSDTITHDFVFGVGSTIAPYDLPTTKYAGSFIIELEPGVDFSGITGVIEASDVTFWLDMEHLPKFGGGYENRVTSRTIEEHADTPVRSMNAILHMVTDGAGSLSSSAVNSWINRLLGTFSAAIFGKRRIIIQTQISGAVGSTDPDDYVPRFWGYLGKPGANSNGDLSLFGLDALSRLQIGYYGDPVSIGVAGSTIPLNEAIQAVFDIAYGPGDWPLYTIGGDLAWEIPAFTLGTIDDALQTGGDSSQQRGAVVRWRYDPDVTERFQTTLFVQQVEKTEPDFTFSASEVEDISDHGSDTDTLRTDFLLRYRNAATGLVTTIHRPPSAAEKLKYGVIPFAIDLGATSQIDSPEEAEIMMDSAETLRVPATAGTWKIPYTPTIEINSLILFTADARVSQEDTLLYVIGWTEYVAMGADGSYERYTIVILRNAPTGQLGRWLESIARLGKGTTTTDLSKLPAVRWLTYSTGSVGTVWWKITPMGLAVSIVEAQTKEPEENWSVFATPTRKAGDASVVNGGTLGLWEFEQDVALVGADAISSIRAQCTVATLVPPLTLLEVHIDANANPKILSYFVDGNTVRVTCDSDTLSIRAQKTAGSGPAYDAHSDSSDNTFTITGLVGTWTLQLTAYNVVFASWPGTLTDTLSIDITATAEPTLAMLPTIPADGSGVISIAAVQATSAPADYTFKVYMSAVKTFISTGATVEYGEIDITPQMSPSPLVSVLPTSPTNYDYSTIFVRDDGGAVADIAMTFRDAIVDADGAVVYSSPPGYPGFTINYPVGS